MYGAEQGSHEIFATLKDCQNRLGMSPTPHRAATKSSESNIWKAKYYTLFKTTICERNAIPPSSRDQIRKPNQTKQTKTNKKPTKLHPQKDVIVDMSIFLNSNVKLTRGIVNKINQKIHTHTHTHGCIVASKRSKYF